MLFSPSQILFNHLRDELLELDRYSRPPLPFALPTPYEAEALPMPADHSLRLYYDQGILPGKKPGKKHQNKTSSVAGTSRLYLPFGKQRELSPEKELFSPHGRIGTYTQRYKSKSIQEGRQSE